MKKEDIITLIQKEVEENSQATSIEISKKHRIPFTIIEVFRRKIEKKMK
ncbi:hypothetical protein ABS315_25655 [Peribacillus frigoritolerans]